MSPAGLTRTPPPSSPAIPVAAWSAANAFAVAPRSSSTQRGSIGVRFEESQPSRHHPGAGDAAKHPPALPPLTGKDVVPTAPSPASGVMTYRTWSATSLCGAGRSLHRGLRRRGRGWDRPRDALVAAFTMGPSFRRRHPVLGDQWRRGGSGARGGPGRPAQSPSPTRLVRTSRRRGESSVLGLDFELLGSSTPMTAAAPTQSALTQPLIPRTRASPRALSANRGCRLRSTPPGWLYIVAASGGHPRPTPRMCGRLVSASRPRSPESVTPRGDGTGPQSTSSPKRTACAGG